MGGEVTSFAVPDESQTAAHHDMSPRPAVAIVLMGVKTAKASSA